MANKLSPLEECIKRAGSDMDKYTDCTAKYISIPRVAGKEEEDEKKYKVKKTTKSGKSSVKTKTKKKQSKLPLKT